MEASLETGRGARPIHPLSHLTAQGIEALTQGAAINWQRLNAHELLVDRVARHLNEQGRVVWSGLMLRAKAAAVSEPGEAIDSSKWMSAIPATQELLRGAVDIHTLSRQMGNSAAMIERHYSKLTATLAAERLA